MSKSERDKSTGERERHSAKKKLRAPFKQTVSEKTRIITFTLITNSVLLGWGGVVGGGG